MCATQSTVQLKLVLACHARGAFAQQLTLGGAERLHTNGVASLREACFSQAYGRFGRLAGAGYALSTHFRPGP